MEGWPLRRMRFKKLFFLFSLMLTCCRCTFYSHGGVINKANKMAKSPLLSPKEIAWKFWLRKWEQFTDCFCFHLLFKFTLRFFLSGFQLITNNHFSTLNVWLWLFSISSKWKDIIKNTGGGSSCRSLLLSAVPPGPRISTGRPGGGHCYRVPARFRRHIQ